MRHALLVLVRGLDVDEDEPVAGRRKVRRRPPQRVLAARREVHRNADVPSASGPGHGHGHADDDPSGQPS